MKHNNKKGFTLAELLIVVAIIAVLVAIAIPTFSDQLERSREAVDISNLRSAYSTAITKIMTVPTKTYPVVVEFEQLAAGWTTDTSDLPFDLPADFDKTADDGPITLFFTKANADKDEVTVSETVTNNTVYSTATANAVTLTGLTVGSTFTAADKNGIITIANLYDDTGTVDTPVSVVAVDFGGIKGLDYTTDDPFTKITITGTPKAAVTTATAVTVYTLDQSGKLGSYTISDVTVAARS